MSYTNVTFNNEHPWPFTKFKWNVPNDKKKKLLEIGTFLINFSSDDCSKDTNNIFI